MRRLHRVTFTTMLALASTVLVAGAVLAQNYPPGEADVSVQKTAVAPGDTQRITIQGAMPASEVEGQAYVVSTAAVPAVSGLYASGPVLAQGNVFFRGSETADAEGVARFAFHIPPDTPDGTAEFQATGIDPDNQPFTVTVQFQIDSSLPITGGQFTVGMALAVAALVAGGALVLISRRRNRRSELEAGST